MEIEEDLVVVMGLMIVMERRRGREGRRRKNEGLCERDERGERGVGDGEGGRDWGVGIWEEIVWVCEGEGGMGREEEGAVVVVVVVGEGRWVDGASGGTDGCSGVVLGSEEWTTSERDDVEMGHTQGGVDNI
ncbi:uncharacterized protein MONOS_17367 [Monocercomonoides exilis]|uniref:uncharacterized protein n=1 Tax=Monocercomonoides exilis TaxID=2049356 RepID=UPI00355A7C67|nr:hypothetical protein MONOS_17367 [Monocercomonoides exilis]